MQGRLAGPGRLILGERDPKRATFARVERMHVAGHARRHHPRRNCACIEKCAIDGRAGRVHAGRTHPRGLARAASKGEARRCRALLPTFSVMRALISFRMRAASSGLLAWKRIMALLVSNCGRNQLGSSKLPALIPTILMCLRDSLRPSIAKHTRGKNLACRRRRRRSLATRSAFTRNLRRAVAHIESLLPTPNAETAQAIFGTLVVAIGAIGDPALSDQLPKTGQTAALILAQSNGFQRESRTS